MKLCLGLIHNKNALRYRNIRPALNKLKDKLRSTFDVEIFEVYQQPEIISHSIKLIIFRKYLFWRIDRDWTQYRMLRQRNIVLDFLVLIQRLILSLFNNTKEGRRSAIDTYITDKHIRIWNKFLEKKGDFLICFEDDAEFNSTSISKFKNLLQEIKQNKNNPLYIDLAGGCSPEELRFERLELRKDENKKQYKKPVTNTGCCYMVNRTMADILFLNLQKYPWLRMLTFDWLLNKIFILTESKYNYLCYHADPHIVNHASVTGRYVSWLKMLK